VQDNGGLVRFFSFPTNHFDKKKNILSNRSTSFQSFEKTFEICRHDAGRENVCLLSSNMSGTCI
jgi:hypothetical protein